MRARPENGTPRGAATGRDPTPERGGEETTTGRGTRRFGLEISCKAGCKGFILYIFICFVSRDNRDSIVTPGSAGGFRKGGGNGHYGFK